MFDLLRVTEVRFAAASDADIHRGLLGRVRMVVNGLVVQGIRQRRTHDARLTLVYPSRRDADGERHLVVRPVDNIARLATEVQVFKALGIKADGPPG